MASGQLFWTAFYDDGTKMAQYSSVFGEMSVLDLPAKGLRRFVLNNINHVKVFELQLGPEHRLIFRRRVILQYGSGSGDDGATVEGKQVYYIVGKQNTATRKLWVDVMNDYGQLICGADGFVPSHPLLYAPEFTPQEGIVPGEPGCPTAACPLALR